MGEIFSTARRRKCWRKDAINFVLTSVWDILLGRPSACCLPRPPPARPPPVRQRAGMSTCSRWRSGIFMERRMSVYTFEFLNLRCLTGDTTKPNIFLSFLYLMYILYIVWNGYSVVCWLHTIELGGLSTTLWMTDRWAGLAHARISTVFHWWGVFYHLRVYSLNYWRIFARYTTRVGIF